nr:MAG TPA: hypothetical protein [Caudoviricetes sp.]
MTCRGVSTSGNIIVIDSLRKCQIKKSSSTGNAEGC